MTTGVKKELRNSVTSLCSASTASINTVHPITCELIDESLELNGQGKISQKNDLSCKKKGSKSSLAGARYLNQVKLYTEVAE